MPGISTYFFQNLFMVRGLILIDNMIRFQNGVFRKPTKSGKSLGTNMIICFFLLCDAKTTEQKW